MWEPQWGPDSGAGSGQPAGSAPQPSPPPPQRPLEHSAASVPEAGEGNFHFALPSRLAFTPGAVHADRRGFHSSTCP